MMRKTIEEIDTNMAYRWFLGYGFHDEVLHFSTLVKITSIVSRIQTCLNRFFTAF
ncbi:transposase [Cytobacillus purgationiresistens]|uniref:Transposase InsH N-terminal domain-containing protein n=1 Tax=Cytobacillus purgationiresistens TaxID=863449 RepID=A0ABU0ASE1_9BACI|nr:hypothetical protein [Cytobacillus purgationiresistens]